MKLGRDISRGKRHLVCVFDPKRSWPWEMVASFRVRNHIFALFSKSILVISTTLSRVIVRGKGRIWPQMALISENGSHFKSLKSHFCTYLQLYLTIPVKLGRDIARCKCALSANLTSNDLYLGKWRPFLGSEIAFLHFFWTNKPQSGMKLFVMVSGEFAC